MRSTTDTKAPSGPAPADVAHALGERVKELNCLYGIARLGVRPSDSVEPVLREVATLLPPAWQYPDRACARVIFRGRRYLSPGFRESRWGQTAAIPVAGETAGELSVFYKKRCPPAHEGPFLREERALIDAAAEYVGLIAGRIEAARQLSEANRLLTVEREALREANSALRAVLARIEEEKREIGLNIHANVERVLLPILQALSLELPPAKREYVEMLRRSLLEISSPYTNRVASALMQLTPAEVAVCQMIRNGLRTKEIARLRDISPATVNRHREHIRRKLGLTRRARNLTTHLQALAAGPDAG
jgi:DNA-binding CsgD family transcriptional regulator